MKAATAASITVPPAFPGVDFRLADRFIAGVAATQSRGDLRFQEDCSQWVY